MANSDDLLERIERTKRVAQECGDEVMSVHLSKEQIRQLEYTHRKPAGEYWKTVREDDEFDKRIGMVLYFSAKCGCCHDTWTKLADSEGSRLFETVGKVGVEVSPKGAGHLEYEKWCVRELM